MNSDKKRITPVVVLSLLILVILGWSAISNLATKQDIRDLKAEIQRIASFTSTQYYQIDQRLGNIDANVAVANQNTQQINNNLARIDASVSGIENKVGATNTAVNNILIYSITLAVVFSLMFNLAWKLYEHRFEVKNDFGGVIMGFLIAILLFVLLIIFGTVRLVA